MKARERPQYRQQPIITLGDNYLYRNNCMIELIEDEQVDFRSQSRGWILGIPEHLIDAPVEFPR